MPWIGNNVVWTVQFVQGSQRILYSCLSDCFRLLLAFLSTSGCRTAPIAAAKDLPDGLVGAVFPSPRAEGQLGTARHTPVQKTVRGAAKTREKDLSHLRTNFM
jgi:hypothetical protein